MGRRRPIIRTDYPDARVGPTTPKSIDPRLLRSIRPKRAIEARTDKLAQPEDPGESAQPRISDTDGFVTEYSHIFTDKWAT
jgi:hypothetical protein